MDFVGLRFGFSFFVCIVIAWLWGIAWFACILVFHGLWFACIVLLSPMSVCESGRYRGVSFGFDGCVAFVELCAKAVVVFYR